MEMDDPWGSPWADEVQDNVQLTQSTQTPEKEQEPIRPTTPLEASSLALQQQTISPWDDNNDGDGAFGAWASMPSDATFDVDGARDDWNQDMEGTSPGKSPERAINNALNPINDTCTFTEGLALPIPGASPGSPPLLRQPSPGPRAFEGVGDFQHDLLGSNEASNKERTTSDQKIFKPQAKASQKAHLPSDSAIELLPSEEEEATPTKPQSDADTVLEKTLSSPTERQHEASRTASSPQEVELMSSRPSSSPSDHSHHNETSPESPRTSLEDELKRPSMPRQVSSKVQELVEHFDTLAKTEEPEVASDRENGAKGDAANNSETPEDLSADEPDFDADDDFGDFGDFEEGQSDVEETAFRHGITVAKTRISDSPKDRLTRASPDPVSRSEDDLVRPVDFTPKSSLLDQLYPDLKESLIPEPCFVPDTVPYDSFASTDERKIWYRVSRYGPMRKYNTGDDENYVRVNWPRSQVRAETLKIVGRWIEEDRMSGRVVLGGGSKAGSLFGWNDTKSRPENIAAAFAERKPRKKLDPPPITPTTEIPREWPKGLARERSTSKGRRSASKARRQSSSKSVTSLNDVELQKQSPVDVAYLGWDTENGPRNSKSSSHRSSRSVTKVTSNTKSPFPIQSHSRRSSINNATTPREGMPKTNLETIFSPPLVKPHLEAVKSTSAVANVFDDDDEWGDMMSSPAVAVAPTLAVSVVSKHEKSQSVSENSLPKQSLSKAKLPDEQARRPRVSFDQILTPQPVVLSVSDVMILPFKAAGGSISDPMSTSVQPAQSKAAVTSDGIDPWASADFSIFESSPSAALEPFPTTIPDKAKSTKIIPNFGGQNVASSSSTIINNESPPREAIEQDKVIKRVLASLPDLSYMLKR
ncbi:hypothetical protein BJ875DRAFT_459686 [Amylocarpus encephaloides]|uniref:Uncharacterized protein n=1 Tax=Amylocarpus encephaloides TaxID=45428 RepID=A0A9P8C7K9_9HELO|nr:hypothetical protein BJ875DRAFT_459686 [Amylocarpus encephaloides]